MLDLFKIRITTLHIVPTNVFDYASFHTCPDLGGFIRDRDGSITGIQNKSGKANEVQQNKLTEEYLNSKITSKEFAAKIDAELLEAWSKKPNKKGVKKGKEEDLKIMLKQYQTAMLKLGREAVDLGLLDPRKFKRNQLNYLAQKYTRNTDNNVFQRDAALLGTREVFNEFKELGKRIVVTPTSVGGADDAPRAIKLLNGQGDAGDSLTNYAKDYPESDIGLDFKMMRDRGMEPEFEYANKLEQYDKVEGDLDGQVNFRRNWTGQERQEMGQINDIANPYNPGPAEATGTPPIDPVSNETVRKKSDEIQKEVEELSEDKPSWWDKAENQQFLMQAASILLSDDIEEQQVSSGGGGGGPPSPGVYSGGSSPAPKVVFGMGPYNGQGQRGYNPREIV